MVGFVAQPQPRPGFGLAPRGATMSKPQPFHYRVTRVRIMGDKWRAGPNEQRRTYHPTREDSARHSDRRILSLVESRSADETAAPALEDMPRAPDQAGSPGQAWRRRW